MKQGDIIQHYKHDPDNGKWHIYEVWAIAEPLPKSSWGIYAVSFSGLHSETLNKSNIIDFGDRHYFESPPDEYDEPHVIYVPTVDDAVEAWARPLSHFTKPMENGRMRFEVLQQLPTSNANPSHLPPLSHRSKASC